MNKLWYTDKDGIDYDVLDVLARFPDMKAELQEIKLKLFHTETKARQWKLLAREREVMLKDLTKALEQVDDEEKTFPGI